MALVLECLVDVLDVEGDILRLAQKLLRALHILLQGLERAIRQARQIAGLIDEHGRLILEALNLVVDLLQCARGREDVFGVIGGIEDDAAEAELRMGRTRQHRRKRDGHGERYGQCGSTDETANGNTDHGRVSSSWGRSGWE